MLTVDKVTMLRHVDIFASTPGRVLAGLASRLVEEEFPPGAELISEGAVEGWLWIISAGSVDVLREDGHTVLAAPAVVGEFQVLDSKPRSATVVALTDVVAQRLDKADFDEALATRPEIAMGVIAALVARIREQREPLP